MQDQRSITPDIKTVSYQQEESSSSNKSDNYSLTEEEVDESGILESESSYTYDYDDSLSEFHSDGTNGDKHLFNMNLLRKVVSDIIPLNPKKYKNGTRKSLSFTNNQMYDIERQNRILLKKILDKGPNYAIQKKNSVVLQEVGRVKSAAAINRKKQQRRIDLDNQVLKRKIEEISRRRRKS